MHRAWILGVVLMLSAAAASGSSLHPPRLRSNAALVIDQHSGHILLEKNSHEVLPIASITKLMTAMVVLDMGLDLNAPVTITDDDVDYLKGTRSRLPVGATLTRDELLRLALMASENRAAAALARSYPGGTAAFVEKMNAKAQALGLRGTRFEDPTGLTSANVSTAEDLAVLVEAAHRYPLIREYTTTPAYDVRVGTRTLHYHNTNRLVERSGWRIGLSKTGFINEAGRCLVMQARLAGRAVIIVLLDSWGRLSRIGDANRIRRWLELSAARSNERTSALPGGGREAARTGTQKPA